MCRARVIPIVIMVVMLVAKKILSRYFAIYHQLANTFLEKMQGMTTLKVYQNDSAAEQELAEESELFRQITIKVLTMQLQLLSTVVMDTVAYGGAACGIVIALNNALNNLRQGQVSRQGAIILILLAASYFLPMRQLGSYFHIGMNGMKASDQIFAFLDLPKKAAGQTSLPKKMALTVSDLSFTYPDAGQAALNQINLCLSPPPASLLSPACLDQVKAADRDLPGLPARRRPSPFRRNHRQPRCLKRRHHPQSPQGSPGRQDRGPGLPPAQHPGHR
ncbi:hypothetical protein [Lactobacillus delbrueckii]|uniref:hypothetical protein n=1 Tax=Lactobacillus delbrueckii TaxID=1584 RepID=UPI001E46303F|nr:hypothetical protein [Lactobacillus delbrueckii]